MSEQTAAQDLPRQAVALSVPYDRPVPYDRRPAATRHRLSLGDRILLDWLPEDGSFPLDIDRLTEVTLARVTFTETERAPDPPSVLTLLVELGLLEQLFTTLTGRPPRTPLRFHTGTCLITAASRPWLAKIQALITSIERNPALAAAPWFQPDIEGWWIAAGLLYALQHNHSHLLRYTSPAPPIVTPRLPSGQFIGPLLTHRRHDLGLSQSALADRLTQASGTPITQGRVSDYEHERHIPDDWLPYLSKVLDLPLDQLRQAAELTRTHRRQHQH